jgi:hypothetical protein
MIIAQGRRAMDGRNWEYQVRYHTDRPEVLHNQGAWVPGKYLNAKGVNRDPPQGDTQGGTLGGT